MPHAPQALVTQCARGGYRALAAACSLPNPGYSITTTAFTASEGLLISCSGLQRLLLFLVHWHAMKARGPCMFLVTTDVVTGRAYALVLPHNQHTRSHAFMFFLTQRAMLLHSRDWALKISASRKRCSFQAHSSFPVAATALTAREYHPASACISLSGPLSGCSTTSTRGAPWSLRSTRFCKHPSYTGEALEAECKLF